MATNTNHLWAQNEPLREWLSATEDAASRLPATLRSRVLRRHARRRLAVRASPVLGVIAVIASVMFLHRPADTDLAQWQARSSTLEAAWRETGNRDWLLSDARARPLIAQLRHVDSALADALAHAGPDDSEALSRLWRQRSDTLTALIESRRQGGVAIQL